MTIPKQVFKVRRLLPGGDSYETFHPTWQQAKAVAEQARRRSQLATASHTEKKKP